MFNINGIPDLAGLIVAVILAVFALSGLVVLAAARVAGLADEALDAIDGGGRK